MHPAERVRFAVETARALLEDRLEPADAAAAVALQVDQTISHLRSDRNAVTRHECETVATTLRLLAEQVNDRASGRPDPDDHLAVATALGTLAQALR